MTTAPEPLPPGLANGHGPAPTAAQQTAQGIGVLINLLIGVQQAIGQIAQQQRYCAQCLAARIQWENAHGQELRAAVEKARQAAGIPDTEQLPAGFDPSPFLPENLRPGSGQAMPAVQLKLTTVNGTDVCAQHIPGVAGGRQPLLIAQGHLTPGMLGKLGG